MNKRFFTGVLTAGLVLGMTAPAFAAQTGLYVGGNYYSTAYLNTLSVAQRAAVLTDTKAAPDTSFAVVGSKYSKFASYTGMGSLVEGADSKVPAQVTDLGTGKVIDPVTGIEIGQGTLTVQSVSAITKTKVEVTFNKAVDAATVANFSIAGVTINTATLSAERTKVTLDITGADWATSYTVKATGLKVAGTAAADLTGTFTSVAVTDAYALVLTSDDASVIADAGHTTTVRAKLMDKVTGLAATNADGMVIQFTTSAGNLANSRVTVQNGEAAVTFISETKTSAVVAKVDAQINEASTDYKALIGKVFGTTNITLTPAGTDVSTKAILTSSQSDIADRVTLHFNKAVSVKDFVKTNLDGTYQVYAKEIAGVVPVGTVSDGGDNTIDGNAVTAGASYTVDIKQGANASRTIRGFQSVASDPTSMVVILDKATTLTDNTNVTVDFVDTVNVVNSSQSFVLTDPRPAEPTSVAVQGLSGVNVVFSEPITTPVLSQISIDAGKMDFSKFTAPTGGFIATGEFDQNKFTDTRNVLSVNFGTYTADVLDTDGITVLNAAGSQVFLAAGNHSIQLAAIQDFAGLTDSKNISTTQSLDFTVLSNAVIPAVTSVVAESPEQFRVKFNCDIATPGVVSLYGLDATGKYVPINTVKINATTTLGDPGIEILKVSNSEYIVQLKKDWTDTTIYNTLVTNKNYYNGKYALHFALDALVNPANGKTSGDAFDSAITGSALTTADVTSPVINNIVAAHDKTANAYDVIMSEPVKVGVLSAGVVNSADGQDTIAQTQSALQTTTVQFLGKDAKGNVVTVDGTVKAYGNTATTTAEFESAGDTIFQVIPNAIGGKTMQSLVNDGTLQGSWQVVVKSISDDIGNTASTLTKTFNLTPVTGTEDFYVNATAYTNAKYPTAGAFEVKLNGAGADTIKVTFTAPVSVTGNVENASNVSNYTLDGNLLPKATTITLTSDVGATDGIANNTMLITLPDGTLTDATSHTLVVAKSLKSARGTAYDATKAVQFVLPAAAPETPAAPGVTRNDTTNSVAGMATGMEYKLDSAGYVAYDAGVFGALDFSGAHTLLVRVAASGNNPAGPETTLTFTINPVEITGYDAVTIAAGGVVATPTYANGAAVLAALPATVTITGTAVTAPVTWADTTPYNVAAAGTYVFTGTIGTLPAGYVDAVAPTTTVTVNVVVAP